MSNQYVVRCRPASTVPCRIAELFVTSVGASVCAAGARLSSAWAVATASAPATASEATMGTTKRRRSGTPPASGGRAGALSGLDQRASGQEMTFVAASTITMIPSAMR